MERKWSMKNRDTYQQQLLQYNFERWDAMPIHTRVYCTVHRIHSTRV